MTNKKGDKEESTLGEDLKGVGQLIVGEIETIGGILTGDPITRAEGEYNVEAGTLRRESSEALAEPEESDEIEKSNQTE